MKKIVIPAPIKKLIIPVLIMGYVMTCAAGMAGIILYWKSIQEDPVQPIFFKHSLHVEKVGLKCTHCHLTADKSPRAGVPPLSICMKCHETAVTERPEVQKLIAYWKAQKPVEWVKVNEVPWHARFTHKRHIKAGVDCAVCHGDLKAMERVRRVRSLSMGWCVDCHRTNGAPLDCWTCHK